MARSRSRRRPGPVAPLLILAALASLLGAWTVPVMQGTALFFLPVSKNMLDVLTSLIADGDHLVATILIAFALVIPALKLILMLLCWVLLRFGIGFVRGMLKLLEAMGRWAMLDIFLAALLVTAFKLEGTPVKATTGAAITLLAVAFLCSALAGWLLKRSIARSMSAATTASRLRIEPTFASDPVKVDERP